MDYQKHYDRLIERAQHRNLIDFGEIHHILPKSLGGNNKRKNLKEEGIDTSYRTCPHCGKYGDTANMKRWHFDNCKAKT